MKTLQGAALGLAGFFLLLALPLVGFAFSLNSTAFNPQFMVKEAHKLDIQETARYILAEQMFDDDILFTAMDRTLTETQPWVEEQISKSIYTLYDYLYARTDNLYLSVPIEPLKESLIRNITEAHLESEPVEYTELSPEEKELYIESLQQQFDTLVPPVVEIDRDVLGPGVVQTLDQLRDIMGYFRTGYYILIAVSIALVLIIIGVLREIKTASLSLGIIFLAGGLISLISFFLCRQTVPGLVPAGGLPVQVQFWLQESISSMFTPWGIFSASISGAGIILILVSVLYSRMQMKANANTWL